MKNLTGGQMSGQTVNRFFTPEINNNVPEKVAYLTVGLPTAVATSDRATISGTFLFQEGVGVMKKVAVGSVWFYNYGGELLVVEISGIDEANSRIRRQTVYEAEVIRKPSRIGLTHVACEENRLEPIPSGIHAGFKLAICPTCHKLFDTKWLARLNSGYAEGMNEDDPEMFAYQHECQNCELAACYKADEMQEMEDRLWNTPVRFNQ